MNAPTTRAWIVLAATTVFACGSNSSSASAGDGGTGSSAASGGTGSGGSAAEQLSDAQVFKVLDNVHAGKIAEAEMAVARASNADVVEFATSLAAEHQQAAEELEALQKKQSALPMDSTLSLRVAAISRVEVDNLTSAATASFDETYLQGQIADHARLAPLAAQLQGAKNGDLKAHVQALLTMANEHHSQATVLLSSL